MDTIDGTVRISRGVSVPVMIDLMDDADDVLDAACEMAGSVSVDGHVVEDVEAVDAATGRATSAAFAFDVGIAASAPTRLAHATVALGRARGSARDVARALMRLVRARGSRLMAFGWDIVWASVVTMSVDGERLMVLHLLFKRLRDGADDLLRSMRGLVSPDAFAYEVEGQTSFGRLLPA